MGQMGGKRARDRKRNAVKGDEARFLNPENCRSHLRKELAREFPSIVEGFVEAAKKGGVPHVKLTAELLAPPPRAASRKMGTMEKLLRELGEE